MSNTSAIFKGAYTKLLTSLGLKIETGQCVAFDNQTSAKFYEQTASGTNFIGICAPNSVTADKTFKLPSGDGTSGQVLSTDGSANLAWASVLTNPMDSAGDILCGGVAGAPTKVDSGTSGQLLTSAGAATPTWTSPVGARYYRSTSLSISNASETRINFDTSVFDSHSAVTTGGSWVFTAPRAGLYLVAATVEYDSTTAWDQGERTYIALYKNGSKNGTLARKEFSANINNTTVMNGSIVVSLAASDTLYITTEQNSGASLNIANGSATTFVSIAELR